MTPYETIRLVGARLLSGSSVHDVCPWCRGGLTKERSFVITRYGADIKYMCHRASCGFPSRGVMSLSGVPVSMADYRPKPVTPREFDWDILPLDAVRYQLLLTRFGFTPDIVNYYNLKEGNNGDIIIPMMSSKGLTHGHEVRLNPENNPRTKSLLYHSQDSDGLAWFNTQPSYELPGTRVFKHYLKDAVVIVEDCYSAMKANAYMHSIALTGTNLNAERAHAIAHQGYSQVVLALDADATSVAVRIAKRMSAILPNIKVAMLQKDIKDMMYDDVAALLNLHYRRK